MCPYNNGVRWLLCPVFFSVFDLLLRLYLILITQFIDYNDSIFPRLWKEIKTNGNTRNEPSNREPVSFRLFAACVMCNWLSTAIMRFRSVTRALKSNDAAADLIDAQYSISVVCSPGSPWSHTLPAFLVLNLFKIQFPMNFVIGPAPVHSATKEGVGSNLTSAAQATALAIACIQRHEALW